MPKDDEVRPISANEHPKLGVMNPPAKPAAFNCEPLKAA